MRFPAFIDEVAFASNPFDSPQIYTDLSTRARLRSWKRGRQTEQDLPVAGSSSTTFENMDRALDPANAASTYAPNIVPMRRSRSRVVRVIPTDATLTVSGNEITDAVRVANVQGDGRAAPDSSFGIWEATTNLCTNGGFKTNLTGWIPSGGNTIARSTAQAKFGAASHLGTYQNNVQFCWFPVTLTASVHTFSVWIYVPTAFDGAGLDAKVQGFVGATGTLLSGVDMSKRDQWQRVAFTFTPVVGALNGEFVIWNTGANPTPGRFIYLDGFQIEQKSFATPYVETDGATASRSAARVQAPASLLNATQGAFVFRWSPGWGTTAMPGGGTGTRTIYDLRDDANNRITCRFDEATRTFVIDRLAAGAGASASSAAQTFALDSDGTVEFVWTATQVKVSVNGGAHVAVGNTSIPTLAATLADIGSQGGTVNHIDGRCKWAATLVGALTDVDAAMWVAFGVAGPPSPSVLYWPDDHMVITGIWQADTAAYKTPTDVTLFTNFIDPELGWQLAQGQTGYSEAIAVANDGFDVLATTALTAATAYAQQAAGARINSILDTTNWPAAERDIDTTSAQSPIQAASAGSLTNVAALDAIQAAVANDNGIFYIDGRGYAVFRGRHQETNSLYAVSQATFCDKANWVAGRFLYTDAAPKSSKIVNDWRVTRQGGTEMIATDSVSILKYGRRTKAVATLHTTDAEALNYAQYRVGLDRDPHRRYDEMTITPAADPDLWLQCFSRQIGDRITVIQSPPGGGAPDVRDLRIEAIDAKVGPGVHAEWKWRLSPAFDQTGWALGDAVYGLLGQSTNLTY